MQQTDDASTPGRLPEQSREEQQYPADWEERRRRVLQRDDFTCQLCGRRGGPYSEDEAVFLHAHHTVPPSRGGSNAVENLLTLCDACYEHHLRQRRAEPASADDGAWLSLGALAGAWFALLGMTAGALEFGATLASEPLFDVNPFAALVVAVVLFAGTLRLVTTHTWGPRFGAVGAALTWLGTLQAGSEVSALPETIQRPGVVAVAVVLTLLPFVVASAFDFESPDDDAAAADAHGA